MNKKQIFSIRLNRYIAMCGICSRRKADQLIQKGDIKINNITIMDMGCKVTPKDTVLLRGKRIIPQKKKYVLLNKPKGYITTMSDEKGRRTVLSLIENACKERLVPVGRLDKDTTGLLLFTNDGILAKKLMHPKYKIKKVYLVCLDKQLKQEDYLHIKKGLLLEDGLIQVDNINYVDNNYKKIKLDIHVGKNRIVRRIFASLGYNVLELDRIMYSSLIKGSLARGEWKHLTTQELKTLHKHN